MNLIDLEIKSRDLPILEKKVADGTATPEDIKRHAEMLALKQAYEASEKRDRKVNFLILLLIVFGFLWVVKNAIDTNMRGNPTLAYLFALMVIFNTLGLFATFGEQDQRAIKRKRQNQAK